jgi:hypothetical protein
MLPIGRRRWAIAEGYLTAGGHGGGRALRSHEAACLLNASDEDAHVAITVFFSDRDPAGPFHVTVPARRTLHLPLDELAEPEPLPRGRDFSTVLEADVPIIVQHTRLDARSAGALLSTMAFPGPE